ncbi:DUF3095 domain-containing protein [Acuticoccus mangrovi]|uniref:DUF3095 domain-containing protein n=1 Tax=Acuticoccus mangrovi TaxID=2796142 RepID=A0A934IMT6_9HYPH|nr:DUF3095 domain-containing protein [Acuticoccus mangrovi]MBJ3775268.1 DUF3095 domain-containing protein [Acuticoccus mangrovi]
MGRLDSFLTFDSFADVTDGHVYRSVPDDWVLGLTDVVNSTDAVARGDYKAVNIAGASAISAMINRLGTRDFAFSFGGDGCAFALPGADREAAATVLGETAAWVRDDLGLDLRAALVPVAAVRAAGRDVRVAVFRPTPHVAYAMFDGGGLAFAEARMKAGDFAVPPAGEGARPDLRGLSCRWKPIAARNGRMLSMVARPGPAGDAAFRAAVDGVLALVGEVSSRPLREAPEIAAFSARGARLEALATRGRAPAWRRTLRVMAHQALGWLVFRTGIRIGVFDPAAYRALVALNADFRKFGDGLQLTLDGDAALEAALVDHLDAAEAAGALVYGLFGQDAALMTCIVPALGDDGHFHFIDGAGGGYTAAARALSAKG